MRKDFIIDAELNWEPVKVYKGWDGVLPGRGEGENPGG